MTGNQLKIIALVAMTIDHIGVVLFPQLGILRIIGRLAYPIFAYMIAEGCFYTHRKSRYLGGIFLLGLACQVVYFAALGSLEQSILTTFALGIITVYAMQLADKRRDITGAAAVAGAILLDACACFVLPALLVSTDYSIDYGFWGVLLPAICYIPRIFFTDMEETRRRLLTLACCAVGLVLVNLEMTSMQAFQWWSLVALVPLAFYNGKRGKWHMKYLFYIYYPAHLVVVWAISLLLAY
jgi:hypothetical protein